MKKLIALIFLLFAYTLQAKYNFLFISVDDLRTELNCFGATHIKSPNIDKLASQGRAFTNHFVQVPTCGASRASMLIGRYPRIYDALSHGFAKTYISTQPESENPESFPHILRRNGYYTISIGKVSHSYDGYVDSKKTKPEFPYSWDERHLESGKWDNAQKAYENFDEGDSKQKNKAAPYECASNEVKFPDELNTDLAIEKLDELKAKDKPFMLAIGYFKPHLPFNSPKRYWDLYEEDDIDVAMQKEYGKNTPSTFGHKSGEFNTYSFEESVSQTKIMSDKQARRIRHAYYACISFTDAQIGRLLNALEEKGLAENTIVVLWGDHGWHLGDNAIWGKHSVFKKALNSPLIIAVPDMQSKGVKSDSIVESVDIYPTICSLANIPAPSSVDGKDLKIILENPSSSVKDFAVSFWKNDGNQIALHSKTESFLDANIFDKEEKFAYFDLTKDPEEGECVSDKNPERAKLLRQELIDFLKAHDIEYPFPKKSNKDGKKDNESKVEKSSKRDGKKDSKKGSKKD